MDHVHFMKEIINDWASDEEISVPGLALKTYSRKPKNVGLPQINNLKNSITDANIQKDRVNVMLNNNASLPPKPNNLLDNQIVSEGKILGCLACGICDFKTNVPTFMKAHMRKHSRKTNVICYKCFRRFSKGDDLVKHIRNVHKKVEYKCSICKFKTNVQSILRKHIIIHSNIKLIQISIEKPSLESQKFECTVCGYQFDNQSWLKKHMKLHEGKTPFVCLVCKNQFKEPCDMKRISDTDNGLMQFQCKCNCKYTLKNPMRARLVLSEGERPFECTVCACKFRHPHVLNAHLKTHFEPNIYQCQYCSNSFRFMAHLESHMKSHSFHNSFGIKKR